jgi:hypothetical protein
MRTFNKFQVDPMNKVNEEMEEKLKRGEACLRAFNQGQLIDNFSANRKSKDFL